jgi:hypothetical protein
MEQGQSLIVDFSKIGSTELGFISVWEQGKRFPFEVKRVFWTYKTPSEVQRGNHVHFNTREILIAAAGQIDLELEYPDGVKERYELSRPDMGIFVPEYCWRTMRYSQGAVQLTLASCCYSEDDYIRDYESFKRTFTNWKRNSI